MSVYQKALDRASELQAADLDQLNGCTQELRLTHDDKTKLKYSSCYFEIATFSDGDKTVKFVVIAPEHHRTVYYPLEDLSELVEIKYVGKKNKRKKIDALKQERKKALKEEKEKQRQKKKQPK